MELIIHSINDILDLDCLCKLSSFLKYNSSNYKTLSGNFLLSTIYDNSDTIIDIVNTLSIDLICLGNNDLYINHNELKNIINRFSGILLTSNISNLHLNRFYITENNSIRICWLGLTYIQDISYIKNNYNYEDIIQKTNYYIEQISNSVDLIILLTNQSNENDILLAEKLPKINIILGGNSNKPYYNLVNNTLIVKSNINEYIVTSITITKHIDSIIYKASHIDFHDYENDTIIEKKINNYKSNILLLNKLILFKNNSNTLLSSKNTINSPQLLCHIFANIIKNEYQTDTVLYYGNILKGNVDYNFNYLSVSDFLNELDSNDILINIKISGKDLQKIVNYSELRKNKNYEFYLQYDSDLIINNNKITNINNKVFNNNTIYNIVVNHSLFTDNNDNQHLIKIRNYYNNINHIIYNGIPIQTFLLYYFIRHNWINSTNISNYFTTHTSKEKNYISQLFNSK